VLLARVLAAGQSSLFFHVLLARDLGGLIAAEADLHALRAVCKDRLSGELFSAVAA